MSNHGQTVKQFWDDMNRHSNANYKKYDTGTVLELEKHIKPRLENHSDRARLVMWVKTDTGWGKAASTWGSYRDVARLYEKFTAVAGEGTAERRRKAQKRIKDFDR